MYRSRLFSCGFCTQAMKPVTLPGEGDKRVVVDICEDCACVLIEYFDGEPATIARALRSEPLMQARALGDLSADAAPQARPRTDPTCPECDIAMELLLYLEEGPPVYRCNQCMAILATAEQVKTLARFEQLEADDDDKDEGGLFGFLRRIFYM